MHRILGTALLVALLLLAGCAPASPGPSEPTEPPDPPLGEVRYSCDGPPGFTPSLLDEPANAETEDHPSAAALRAAIAEAGQEIDMLPKSGYWLASRDDRVAEYMAANPAGADPPWVSATLENHGDGWKLAGWGQCRPRIVLEGLSPATWVLDPTVPRPDADSTTFAAIVTETTCTSGQAMGERLLPPSITYAENDVFVVFAARPLEGDAFNCPSNPPSRVVVQLREPLGARKLLDAGVFPPSDPAAPPS